MLLIILNIIFCLAFIAFAYVNLNDNDAWLWISIYMAVAVCCGLVVFKLYYPIVYLGLCAFYLIYAVILFFVKNGVRDWIVVYKRPSIVETMQAEKLYIEKTREFFGLLIITGALLIDYLPFNFFEDGLQIRSGEGLPAIFKAATNYRAWCRHYGYVPG